MKRYLITILTALLVFSLSGNAQSTTDLGTWCNIQLVKSFGAPYAMARLEHRSFDSVRSTECWFAMVGGGYNFNKWLKGDLSYEFWSIPSAGQMIQHKAVLTFTETLRRDGLAVFLREKYELAFNPATHSFSNTLRARLRGEYKIPESRFTPYAMYELFGSLDGAGWVRSLHYAGTEISLGRGHSLDFYYLYHFFNKAGLTSACHVLGIGYTLVF